MQAADDTDDTLSQGRAVEHTTAEYASSGSVSRTHQGSGTHYESAAPSAATAAAPHNPEDDLARTQDQERVRQVLAVIKPDHAALLMLRAEGLSYQELAAALRINPASVGSMLARAESKFRQEYEKRHGDEHGRA